MNIDHVYSFWEENPLWTGESQYKPGTKEFFKEHRSIYIEDCFAGTFDQKFFPPPSLSLSYTNINSDKRKQIKILDLGCGIGFWAVEFGLHGFNNIVAADLTNNALKLTGQRAKIYGLQIKLKRENAENLSFADNTFDHVNCQGVIHHTPDTQKAVSEIERVLKPGGTACISVYYRNLALKVWPSMRWIGRPLTLLGGGMKGRGRENIFSESNVDEIVRLYDGSDNPIGKSYSREQFVQMLSPHFKIKDVYFHFFPARALPIKVPFKLHAWLDRRLPFMIYGNLEKPCAD